MTQVYLHLGSATSSPAAYWNDAGRGKFQKFHA